MKSRKSKQASKKERKNANSYYDATKRKEKKQELVSWERANLVKEFPQLTTR